MDITLNDKQRLYVIKTAGGYTCHGYQNVADHANLIAGKLGNPDLEIKPDQIGTLEAYRKYGEAVAAWATSPQSAETYFASGTPVEVQKTLERYRANGRVIRLFLGDPESGRDWCDAHDSVGCIGRSMGPMRVPLLLANTEDGSFGGAILCANVLRMMDAESGRELYRHPRYQTPELSVQRIPVAPGLGTAKAARQQASLPVAVLREEGEVLARFRTDLEAHEHAAFLRGEVAAKREHMRVLRLAA